MALLCLIAFCFGARAQTLPAGAFVTTWATNSTQTSIRFGATVSGSCTAVCTPISPTTGNVLTRTLSNGQNTFNGLQSGGTYQIAISGGLTSVTMGSSSTTYGTLTQINQWGNIAWTTMYQAFDYATNLTAITATDAPNLSAVTNMGMMFYYCQQLSSAPNMNSWDLSNVKTTNLMFCYASVFNVPIGNWNVSNDTDMSSMFYFAASFNQDISGWNTKNVTSMNSMFYAATYFNSNIGGWDVSNVTNMYGMFGNAKSFNQDISKWNTANVITLQSMFYYARIFNQNIGSWNLSSISTSQSYNLISMFDNSGLSCANYSGTLIGWNNTATTPNGLTLGAASLTYDATAGGKTLAARTSLTTTKGWTITGDAAGSCTVLPITLAAFNAYKEGNTAQLQWTTVTEINDKGFEIQRSTDAQTWSSIGFVNSKAVNGNSSSSLNYSFTDNSPASGINYYRLKQTDLNGNAAFSPVRSVNFSVKATVYPVPASTQLYVMVAASCNYQLIDVAGSVVLTGNLNTGNNIISVSGIAAGTYLLRITSNGNSTVYKVIKK